MVIIGILIGYKLNETGNEYSFIDSIDLEDTPSADISVGRIEELIRFIDSKYVDSIDQEVLLSDAIKNIVSHLDPHSVYLDPEEAAMVNDQVAGVYKGIGIETKVIGDTVYLHNVLVDSPAEKVGLQRFDVVKAINGIPLKDYKTNFDTITASMKSRDKQQIDITRGGSDMSFAVVKEVIPLNSCENYFTINDSVGYIEIKRFSQNTYKEFMDALELLVEEQEIKDLIIDVRDNGGGLLPEVAKILSQLINEEKQLLVYTEGLHQKREEYRSTGKVFFPVEKIAVLINNQSASGSEILAGAIQDLDRGIVLGEASYGKGLVQEQYELKNSGALRLTVAKYYTPSGRSIQRPFDVNYGDIGLDAEADLPVLIDTTQRDSIDRRYRTLYKNRIVYSNGGIMPDIEVKTDQKAGVEEDMLQQILLRKALAHEITLTDSLTVDRLMEEDSSLSKKLKVLKLPNKDQSIANVAYTPVYAHRFRMIQDTLVQIALDQFAKKEVFDY